jgi:ABC-type dipeptide/oligopeptide/nickel transport systems, permease components
VTLLVFVVVRLTGDPTSVLLPPETPAEQVEEFRRANGLDLPLITQYFTFLGNLLTGDLGNSLRYGVPVSQLIAERLPATLELTLGAVIFSTTVGLILGVLGALRRGGAVDYAGRFLALAGQAVPTFFLGILLILLFGVVLQALPTVGRGTLANLILPSVTLGFFLLPLVLRVARGSVLDVVHQDYVRTARSKGMSEARVVSVHVLKSALIPVVTVLGLQVGAALSGAVVTEIVFAWPGLGQLLVNAVSTRDFPVVQGVVLFAAAVFVGINLLVDIAYSLLDPRIRLS